MTWASPRRRYLREGMRRVQGTKQKENCRRRREHASKILEALCHVYPTEKKEGYKEKGKDGVGEDEEKHISSEGGRKRARRG